MDHLSTVLSRIEEIRDRFGIDSSVENAGGACAVETGTQPFSEVLANMLKTGTRTLPSGPVRFEELINSAAARHGVQPTLLKAVIRAESGFRPNAVSPAGAMGLMQLMPRTAQALGVADPFDPAQNIDGGAKYLRQQLDRFGDVTLALAAYNAGPASVARYGGIPPYRETQRYIGRVLEYARDYGTEVASTDGSNERR